MNPSPVIIVACTKDFAIGRNGDLLYHISDDLKRFKSLTMGHPIIMGRKTFESFPNGALPGRRNIVVTRNNEYSAIGADTALSLKDALSMCGDDEEPFVIGGGEIYVEALPLAKRMELTLIDALAPDADTFFPALSSSEWGISMDDIEFDRRDDRCGVKYTFLSLDRIEGSL